MSLCGVGTCLTSKETRWASWNATSYPSLATSPHRPCTHSAHIVLYRAASYLILFSSLYSLLLFSSRSVHIRRCVRRACAGTLAWQNICWFWPRFYLSCPCCGCACQHIDRGRIVTLARLWRQRTMHPCNTHVCAMGCRVVTMCVGGAGILDCGSVPCHVCAPRSCLSSRHPWA